jgi:glycosyltransferase involved in cell wall biosynthesis
MTSPVPSPDRLPLTAIVPTFNSADVLPDCLKSLDWVDNLIVVDSGSRDDTAQIATQFGARVLFHAYENPSAQKRWVIPQARRDWILWIDSDERISPALRAEIGTAIQSTAYQGYRMPRLNDVFGKPVRHAGYYPDYQTRLFHKDAWSIPEDVQIHEHILINGTVGTLQNPLYHLAHRTIDQTTATLLIRWTTFEAQQRYSRGVRYSTWQMFGRGLAAFMLRYVRQQGFRDGLRGLFVSSYWGMYLIMTYLKLWELENSPRVERP